MRKKTDTGMLMSSHSRKRMRYLAYTLFCYTPHVVQPEIQHSYTHENLGVLQVSVTTNSNQDIKVSQMLL